LTKLVQGLVKTGLTVSLFIEIIFSLDISG